MEMDFYFFSGIDNGCCEKWVVGKLDKLGCHLGRYIIPLVVGRRTGKKFHRIPNDMRLRPYMCLDRSTGIRNDRSGIHQIRIEGNTVNFCVPWW